MPNNSLDQSPDESGERVSHQTRCGEGWLVARRPVNSDVVLLSHITRYLVLVAVVMAIVSVVEAKTICDLHLSRVKNMPFTGERSQDAHYDAIKNAGKSAVPCLIANVTNRRYARDPRPIPRWGRIRTTVGHRAVYMLWDMTNVDPIKMLPLRYQRLHKQIGVYALDEYLLDSRANPRTLQRKLWRWYRTTYLPYVQGAQHNNSLDRSDGSLNTVMRDE